MKAAAATSEVDASRRDNLLLLRWIFIIATSYLLLFATEDPLHPLLLGAIVAFLASNVAFHQLAETILFEERTLSGIALADSLIASSAILVSEVASPRLLVLFFFVLLIAAVGHSFVASLIATTTAALMVPVFVGSTYLGDETVVLGIPFIFCAGAFYAYLSAQVRGDRERALVRARDAALEASRLKTAFLANVTHEIRTPLNVILGGIDALDAGIDGVEHREAMRRAGERLTETIDHILNFARIESRAFHVTPRPIVVAKTVRECAEEGRLAAERKGLRFECTIGEADAVVPFDEYCLSEALRSLVANAVKFTDTGTVSIVLEREAGVLSITVSDTGVGIGESYLPRLFEPFSQEDAGVSKRFEGAGLGLALARSLLALNRAVLEVRSDKGRGSRFTIRLPSRTGSAASSGEAGTRSPDSARG